ncbi:Uncharacterized protein PHSC3_000135 [Chlamydiales bacterium STE3]|nr:Uncharacterized protein PHSC3_000135 [Chlamydiales bacterium STE3]
MSCSSSSGNAPLPSFADLHASYNSDLSTRGGDDNDKSETEVESPPRGRSYFYLEAELNSDLAPETYLIGNLDPGINHGDWLPSEIPMAKINFLCSTIRNRFISSNRRATREIEWIGKYKGFDLEEFSKRKVLVLIHGFNVDYNSAVKTLRRVSEKVKHTYHTVIAYLYPTCAKPYHYPDAEKNAIWAGQNVLPGILSSIQKVADKLDVAAHSMGTVATLNAFSQEDTSPKIHNLFLIGGAVEEKSLFECEGEECTRFPLALSNSRKIYVLYSCEDQVLPWLRFFQAEQPVGLIDEEILQRPIAKNVCFINSTPVVKSHSGYYKTEEVFKFFKLVAHHDSQETHLEGPYFSLTSNELSFAENPLVCSKETNKAINMALLVKKIVVRTKKADKAKD